MNEGNRAEVFEAGKLVVYACAGILSVSKACMLLSKDRRFMECKAVSSRRTRTISQLILLYARPVLNKESNIDGEVDVRSPAEL